MWLFFNDAFLSIVDPDGAYDGRTGPQGDKLLIRARIKGDIEAVFPKAEVIEGAGTDYRFRALIPREVGAKNFKGSVKDRERHDVYMQVWHVLNDWQERALGRFRRVVRRTGTLDF
jgi:hypothetical protein